MTTYPDLDGKVVLVTGGGSGIGASMVEHFAGQGAKVGFLDIADEPSQALADAHENVAYERADVTDIKALRGGVERVRERFGPVTALINNAAHDERHAWRDVTPDYWDGRMAVNLRHQFFAAQAVAPDMIAAGGGAIVNLGSTSWMLGVGGMAAYTAAKSAILGLTRSLARDLGPDNVRVNALTPGWIMTERQKELWVGPDDLEKLMADQCLKRELVGADIARVALFLCSDASSACTAQDFIVDGGLT